MTAKAQIHPTKKIDLSTEGTEESADGKKHGSTLNTPSSSKNSGGNIQFTMDYLKNRDPMKEFFSLVSTSFSACF